MLLGSKPNIIRQAVAAPEDEKTKKFATAIVEFSKVKIANALSISFGVFVFFPYPGGEEEGEEEKRQFRVQVH